MGATNSVNSQERQNRAILKANQNIQDMIANNPEFMEKAMKQGLPGGRRMYALPDLE